MTTTTTQLVPTKRKGHRWSKQPSAVELSALSVRPAAHYTRAWSATTETVSLTFRLSVLPVRALALFVLWGTSSPHRLAGAVTLSCIVALILLA